MKLNKKILGSLATIGAVASLAVFATGAFFSDTETSLDNRFEAGAIDLQIDNESYAIDWNIPGYNDPTGAFVASTHTSWELADLTIEKFFDFVDLKPGDYGEDTISIHVDSNDAWLCAAARLTDDNDNTYSEPELEDDQTVDEDFPETTDGELDDYVNFVFWWDDGDNVYEEQEQIFLQGPVSGLGGAGQIALADTNTVNPIPGGETVYIGKYWCFGDYELTPLTQDDSGESNPIDRQGTGFLCNGEGVDNAPQTDVLLADLQFYAEQHRNNPNFSCSEWTPDWPDNREPVGALLSSYAGPPDQCDATLNSGDSVQAAIDAATAGNTICLNDGTYSNDTYPLRLNKDNLTLAGVNPPVATAELSGGVIIDNDGGTVTGLKINDSTALSETFGVYVNTGVDNATVSHNVIVGPGVGSGRGVVNALGTTTNLTVFNNDISNFLTGVFMNDSSGMVISYNTLHDNGVGSGNDHPVGNMLHHNVIKNNTLEGVGVFMTAGDSIQVNFNNLYGNPTDDQMNNYSASEEVDAENNWWGDDTPANNINGAAAGPIDYEPFETSAFPEN